MTPPHVGIKTGLNPVLPKDLHKKGVVIPFTATPWAQSGDQKRLAMVNNFGAAGGNTAMIVEEATPRSRVGDDTRHHLGQDTVLSSRESQTSRSFY